MKKLLLSIILFTAHSFVINAQWNQITPIVFDGAMNGDIAFADIDGDNDQDVLITGDNGTEKITKLYTNNGSGTFTLVTGTPFDGVSYSSIAFADIDGDNDQDVLITGDNGTEKIAKLYINNGSGTFTLATGTPFDGVSYSSIAFADIDGDNDQDVLITGDNGTEKTTRLYTNNGSGTFTLVTGTPFVNISNGSIAFADVDGDNDQDLLITGSDNVSMSQSTATLYTNNGSGIFTKVTPAVFDAVRNSSISFADIDGDNDQDLLISGISGLRETILYTNSGNGTFTKVTGTPFQGLSDGSVAFADIDNDNDQDLLITGWSGDEGVSKLYTNNGSGTFTEVTGTPFENVYNSSIAFADIDGDNDQDIFITGYSFRTGYNSQEISKLYRNSAIVGILETVNEIDFKLYPNPVFNQLSIINNELSILKIDIIDVMGKTIKTITENTNSIDVSELSKGTYFIKIQTTKRQINKRLVKM